MSSKAIPSPPANRTKGKKQSLGARIRKSWVAYLFISPFYLIFLVFGLFPIFYSIHLSFNRWNGISAMEFVGVSQYASLLQDADFWMSLKNTMIIWVESTLPMIFFAMVIAFLLNTKHLKGTHTYRTLLFLPNVTSTVAVAIVFATLFGNKYGLINYALTSLGLNAQPWLQKPGLLQAAISIMSTWRWTGYNAIIFLAGLQNIDYSLYEAARIDGANTFEIFWKIALPLLNPVILFVVITSTIGGLQIFTEPQVLVGDSGGAGGGGMTIVLYLYRQAFVRHSFGYAAAVSWMLFLIIGVFSLINWRLVEKAEH